MVTNNKADVAKHKLNEGAAREPMYKVKRAHNGIREYLPADYDNGMAMYD